MSLTLLNPLDVAGTAAALTPFNVAAADDRYTDQALQTSLLFLTAFGVTRLAHVNDQPVAEWGPVLDTPRRPDADTLAQYLQAIQAQELVVAESPAGVVAESPAPAAAETPAPAAPAGQVAPAGRIAQAQSQTLVFDNIKVGQGR